MDKGIMQVLPSAFKLMTGTLKCQRRAQESLYIVMLAVFFFSMFLSHGCQFISPLSFSSSNDLWVLDFEWLHSDGIVLALPAAA